MSKYKLIYEGEQQDEEFDTEKEADDYALYLSSCSDLGAELLNLSNPGDYDSFDSYYDDELDYEIIKI